MAKRFTDSKKWRNEWFRTLPIKARLTWIYLCDECESTGIMKMDWGLASFQLGFSIDAAILQEWFGDKIYFIDTESFLIVQFFNFQYGESKDTWSAKIEAKKKLEILGFTIVNDKVQILNTEKKEHSDTTVGIQSLECNTTPLIRVKGRVKGRVSKGGMGENSPFEKTWSLYPNKVSKAEGFQRLAEQNLSSADIEQLERASANYARYCELPWNDWYTPKHFDVWCGAKSKSVKPWHEWKDPDPSVFEQKQKSKTSEVDMFAFIREKEQTA